MNDGKKTIKRFLEFDTCASTNLEAEAKQICIQQVHFKAKFEGSWKKTIDSFNNL
jgi:hypothetical protein